MSDETAANNGAKTTSDLYDEEVVKTRIGMIEKLFKTNSIPDDENTAVALFGIAIHQLVFVYGPHQMGTLTGLFVDLWRHAEGEVISDAVKSVMLKKMLEAQTKDGPKH